MRFYYKHTGEEAKGNFKYVVLENGSPRFCHRKSEMVNYQGTQYQWNKEKEEYEEIKK